MRFHLEDLHVDFGAQRVVTDVCQTFYSGRQSDGKVTPPGSSSRGLLVLRLVCCCGLRVT